MSKSITILPLLGDLHVRYPRYNSEVLRSMAEHSGAEALALPDIDHASLETPSWQDSPESCLAMGIVPWARARSIPIYGVHRPSPDSQANQDFIELLSAYPQGQQKLQDSQRYLGRVQECLEGHLDCQSVFEQLLPLVRRHQHHKEEVLESGPGMDWLRGRCEQMAQEILRLREKHILLACSIDKLVFLLDAFSGVDVRYLEQPPESKRIRARSLLDFAFYLDDVSQAENLIHQLQAIDVSDMQAEAQFHIASLLLVTGHPEQAHRQLEKLAQGDFSRPYYLPGFVLARLGQLRDLIQERSLALRAYQAVLALDYAPTAAKESARQGLNQVFGA